MKLVARRLVRRTARRAGLDVVPADFYSPIVDPRTLPSDAFERAAPMPGLALDLDGQLEWIEAELLPLILALDVPLQSRADPHAIHLDNGWYGPLDAHILYAGLRRWRPRRVLELGSGFSSLFIDRALADAGGGEHEIVDPFPSPVLDRLTRPAVVQARSAAELAGDRFARLQAGDVLFVDTSHTVKPGGEVVRLVLEVLGELAPGVLVHFHDIYRPFAYPRVFYEQFNVHWQEQYLLQALLVDNPRFTVVCANHALWRLRRERVTPWFRGLREGMEPSGFWFRRTDAA